MNIIHSSLVSIEYKRLCCEECKDELIFIRKQILESEIQLKPNRLKCVFKYQYGLQKTV